MSPTYAHSMCNVVILSSVCEIGRSTVSLNVLIHPSKVLIKLTKGQLGNTVYKNLNILLFFTYTYVYFTYYPESNIQLYRYWVNFWHFNIELIK